MSTVVLASRVGLAVVFLIAAIGKFADLRGSRASLVGFGVPERAAGVLGTLLPVAELCVAVTLIPVPTAQWGALGALILLLGSSAASSSRCGAERLLTATASARFTRLR